MPLEGVPPEGRTFRCDVVVVGSGPGGAAVSRALAAGGLSVVVLEEGPPRSRFRPNYAHTARHHMQEGGTITPNPAFIRRRRAWTRAGDGGIGDKRNPPPTHTSPLAIHVRPGYRVVGAARKHQ